MGNKPASLLVVSFDKTLCGKQVAYPYFTGYLHPEEEEDNHNNNNHTLALFYFSQATCITQLNGEHHCFKSWLSFDRHYALLIELLQITN